MRQLRNYWHLVSAGIALLLIGLAGCKKKEKDSPSGGGSGGSYSRGFIKAQLNGRTVQADVVSVIRWSDRPFVSMGGTAYVGRDTFTISMEFQIPTSRSDTSYTVRGDDRGAIIQIYYNAPDKREIYVTPYSGRNRFARLSMDNIRVSGDAIQGRFSGMAYNLEVFSSVVDSMRITDGEFQAR